MTHSATDLPTGTHTHGYVVRRRAELPLLHATYVELVHKRSGARHIHVARPDDNNVFAVVFPTIPHDSSGVAHVLEHIVLSGSRRYPVRDPFFAMLPRSLATFMNALTSSTWTAYPFATRNQKDFFNLLDVYLDACFFPNLDEYAFLQEAHRLEFVDPEDPNSPLRYAGVVYNEMKGAMATAPARMEEAIGKALFPDLPYAYNSGGDPLHIPELTWEKLKEFHSDHYHPSNAYFYTYGNLGLEDILAKINEVALQHFEYRPIDTHIPDQPSFESPRTFVAHYPLSASENDGRKSQALIAWRTVRVDNSFDTLAFEVLEDILLGHEASPLRRALIESNLGSALADGTGFDTEPRDAVFAAGLKDIADADAARVEQLVLETLARLANEGIEPDLVDGAIHGVEIASREVSNAGIPYGLKLLFHCAGAYLYGGDPHRALLIEPDLEQLRRERAAGPFFEGLIQRHLLENPNRVRILLSPDDQLTAHEEALEAERLAAVQRQLDATQRARIIQVAAELQARQQAPADVSCLPTLTLADIPTTLEDVPHSVERLGKGRLGLFPQPTNGLSYVDIRFRVGDLSPDELELLPVLAHLLPRSGAGSCDHVAMARRISRFTGGIGSGFHLRTVPDDLDCQLQSFGLSGSALYRNHEALADILGDFLTGPVFDPEHVSHLLGEYRAGLESRIVVAGHLYSIRLADAQLSSAGQLRERLAGLSQLALARQLATLRPEELEPLLERLHGLCRRLFRSAPAYVCLTSEEEQLPRLADTIRATLAHTLGSDAMAQEPAAQARELPVAELRPVARTTAVPVAYVAQVFRTVPYSHPDAPPLMVLANLLRATHIHREVREKGGAYGGHAMSQPEHGLLIFVSYRDPHIVRTFRAFSDAVEAVLHQAPTEREMNEAIIESAGDVDPLLSPDTKGRDRFFSDLAGYTLERKTAFKRALLTVTAEDVQRVAAQYLRQGGAMAVIGGEEKVRAANQELGNLFDVSPV